MGAKFRFQCSKSLFGEFTKLRKKSDLTVDNFLYSLLVRNTPPHDYQIDYKPVLNSSEFVHFDQRLHYNTIQKFKLFSSSFKNYYHALDFLIENEKNQVAESPEKLDF